MQYGLLGSLECRRDGQPVDLGVYKQRSLLAILLINANQVVSTDRIIDELWSEDSDRDRQKALWVYVSRLRGVLEPDREKRTDGTILLTRHPGYVLIADPDDLDSSRFEALAIEGRSLLDVDPAAASLVLSEALALWRGHALEEFTYESFAEAEINRLEELRLATVENRVRADLRIGRSQELIGELESLVRQHPLRERLTEYLMLALYRSGRQADALRAFRSLETSLGEELGIAPSAELATLEERIVLGDPALFEHAATGVRAHRPEPGLSVRGYELREKIGEGALGHVYRAYQPAVGREVAIKVIRPELANDPDFIRQFESGAHLVARLEHPRIVPLFDYWREPDSAYLVMRRFEHGSLRDTLDAGPLSPDRAVRVMDHVAGALAAAHRKGVAHGDVKPANVLMDGDGNAYLADFGLSLTGGDASSDAASVAPEQRDTGDITPLADQYSFAIMVGQLLPDALAQSAGNENSLMRAASVIARASADDPAERFPDIESFMDELEAVLGRRADPNPVVAVDDRDADNPYRGLNAFEEGDAARFFGRERLVERLLARLGHNGPQGRMVVLVGPSGAGKSSVIQAGVVPALRGGALPGSPDWYVVTMVPGRQPFEALEDALLSVAVEPPPDLLDGLTSTRIASVVTGLLPRSGSQLVLVVDQLEELFSHAAPRDAEAFLDALAAIARDRHAQVKVVATLRADFYDRPLRHEAFGELLRLGTEVITPMTASELERAATAPAAMAGVSFEPGLVAQIVSDMAGQSGALPLMQYALTELFEQRSGPTITADAYERLGGVSAALVHRADSLYEELAADARGRTRDVFLRLVSLGESADDTRRRVLVSEIAEVAGDASSSVLETFGRHRLLSFDRDPVTRAPTVEIAHEALLSEWGRLRDWISDARVDLQAQRRLAVAAAEWGDRGHSPDFLLSGARFTRYSGWLDHPPVRLTADEHRFLAASGDAAEAHRAVEQRRVRRLRRLVAGTAIALAIAVIAGGLALRAQRRADDEAARAEAAAVEAEAQTQIAQEQAEIALTAVDRSELATLISRSAAAGVEDPEVALLLALEAHQRAPGSETEQAVLDALGGATIANRVAGRAPLPGVCVGFSVFWGQGQGLGEFDTIDGRIVSRDPLTGTMTDHGAPPAECAIGFVDEVAGVAMAVAPGALRHWVGSGWDLELEFDELTFPIWITPDRYVTLSFGDETQTITIYDTGTGEAVGSVTGGIFLAMAATDDGSLFAISFARPLAPEGDGRLFVVDAGSGQELFRLDTPDGAGAMVFDNAAGELIAGYLGGSIVTIDPSTSEVLATVDSDAFEFVDLGLTPEGLVVAVSRGNIQVVDRRTGPTGASFELRDVGDGYVRPDGTVVTTTGSGEIEVVDLNNSALVRQSIEIDPVGHVGFGADQATVLNPATGHAEVIHLTSGERSTLSLTLPDGGRFEPLFVHPVEGGVWAMSIDLTAARWEDDQLVEEVFLGSEPGVTGLRDGRTLNASAYGSSFAVIGVRPDGTREASLVSLEPGSAGVLFTAEVADAAAVHPGLNGDLYAVDTHGTLRSYDTQGDPAWEVELGTSESTMMALDPTRELLAIGDFLGGVHLVDLVTREVETIPTDDQVESLGFARGGRFVVIARRDGTIRLWDVDRSEPAGLVWNGSGSQGSEPPYYDDANGSLWVASSGKLLEVPLDPESWVDRACEIVGRDLTQDEWDRFVPGDHPPRSACDAR